MILVILSAYNEEKDLLPLLRKIDIFMSNVSYDYRLIIVNDGSTDGTLGVIRQYMSKMPIDLIDFSVNRGVGEAFRTAFNKMFEIADDSDIVVTMDADNTHNPDLIKEMIGKMGQGNDVIVASCYGREGRITGLSFLRTVLSRGCNFVYRFFFPIKGITLYTGFYRAYRVGAIKKTRDMYGDNFIQSKGFGAMAELLIKFRKVNLKIAEVPMTIRYNDKEEKTKLKIIPTIKEHMFSIFKNIYNDYRG